MTREEWGKLLEKPTRWEHFKNHVKWFWKKFKEWVDQIETV